MWGVFGTFLLLIAFCSTFKPSEDVILLERGEKLTVGTKILSGISGKGVSRSEGEPKDGGIFGVWSVDAIGLPYFVLEMDEMKNPKASWPNTQQVPPLNVTRTDHFYLFGNDRINVKAVDDGYLEVFGSDRGPMWCNYYEPEYSNLAGGFSYISWVNSKQERTSTSSAYQYGMHNSPNTRWTREFHIGSYKSSYSVDNITVTRVTSAPFGDYSFVVDEIEITNTGDTPIDYFDHYEFWDLNYWQMELEWFRTGYFAVPGDKRRHDLNRLFTQSVSYNSTSKILLSHMYATETPPVSSEEPSEVNYYPLDIFLAVLDGEVDNVFWNQTKFFGTGNFSVPQSVDERASGDPNESGPIKGLGQELIMAMKTTLSDLQANQTVKLRFAYGYVPSGSSAELIIEPFQHITNPVYNTTATKWKEQSGTFEILRSNVNITESNVERIEREFIWRTAQLQASSLYHEYFGNHVIPQGSEYLYLSGADGAPRDLLLSLAANVLLSPQLSKETLSLVMSTQDSTTGAMWYAIAGYGEVSPALDLHKFPSDLDIFLFLAFNEYISATGDTSFITETSIPFYPKSSPSLPPGANSTLVLDHIRAAFYHLKNEVGIGSHGLIKILQGDWDDGVVYSDPDPLAVFFSIKHGESIPNTQMALYCLPITAKIIEPFDSNLAEEIQNFADSLVQPTKEAFGRNWFGRAWLRNRFDVPYLRGNDHLSTNSSESYIDLEAQPWGLLIDNLLSQEQIENVYKSIETYLDSPSPIGPLQSPNGYVWPAISQLLPWAYSKNGNTEKAWEIFQEHLYATHAHFFPDVWMGIWSGPDGWVAYLPKSGFEIHGYEGGTWYSLFTPMTDFPVSNSNPDAMYTLALERIVGIEPCKDGDGLFVNATRAGMDYNIQFPMMHLVAGANSITGTYKTSNKGSIVLTIALPSHATPICQIHQKPYPCKAQNMQVKLPLGPFQPNEHIQFQIEFQ